MFEDVVGGDVEFEPGSAAARKLFFYRLIENLEKFIRAELGVFSTGC